MNNEITPELVEILKECEENHRAQTVNGTPDGFDTLGLELAEKPARIIRHQGHPFTEGWMDTEGEVWVPAAPYVHHFGTQPGFVRVFQCQWVHYILYCRLSAIGGDFEVCE